MDEIILTPDARKPRATMETLNNTEDITDKEQQKGWRIPPEKENNTNGIKKEDTFMKHPMVHISLKDMDNIMVVGRHWRMQ